MYTLRPYQKEAVDIGVAFLTQKSKKIEHKYMVEPTGSGKSLIIAAIVKELPGNTIVLQPSSILLDQNYEKFISYGGEASIYSASKNIKEIGRVTFATIGSVVNNLDLFEHFQHIIIDECHQASPDNGSMHKRLFAAITGKFRTLGLTATPIRLKNYMDQKTGEPYSMLRMLHRTRPKIFKDIIHVTQISECYDNGYLTPVRYIAKPQDTSELKPNSTGAEYTAKSILKYFIANNIGDQIVDSTNELLRLGHKHILVFVSSIEEAEMFVEKLPGARMVHSKLHKDERKQTLEMFTLGICKVVVNIGVLTTGFDFPALSAEVNGRPTMSLGLYYQIVGRLVRLFEGKKEAVYVDLTDNYNRFGDIATLTVEKIDGQWEITQKGKVITSVPIVESTDSNKPPVIPFGKFAGMPVQFVDRGYLRWFLNNIERKAANKHIFTAIEKILN